MMIAKITIINNNDDDADDNDDNNSNNNDIHNNSNYNMKNRSRFCHGLFCQIIPLST